MTFQPNTALPSTSPVSSQPPSRPPLLLPPPLLTMPTIPPPNLLPPHANLRPQHTLIPILRQPQTHQPEIIIQRLRVQQTHTPPILIHTQLQVSVRVAQLALQVLDLADVERGTAIVVLVEGVVGQGLQVGEVGVVAHGLKVFEHADDVVAGVVEDPVAASCGGQRGRVVGGYFWD